jgi:RNA polymerase sigma-70 factor (ECF subfamily)
MHLHSPSPQQQLEREERIDSIHQTMNSLPEKQRTAMQLRDFEGKSYREIADVMQISEDQVKINIYRARQAVKQKLTSFNASSL